MTQRIKVLGIAPYESMCTMMADIAKSYPEIYFKAYVGDLADGLEIAKRNFKGNYDLIISRGATAKMIRDAGMPVIEVEISSYDILCALKLASGFSRKSAIVSFADITSTANEINALFGFDIDIFTLNSNDSILDQLKQIDTSQYEAIVCDMVVDTLARLNGINSFLITSGEKSIHRAFKDIRIQYESDRDIHIENEFLRHMLNEGLSYTIVFDDKKDMLFSSIHNPDPNFISMLKNEILLDEKTGSQKLTKEFAGLTYKIKKELFYNDGIRYHVFYFVIRKSPLAPSKMGIRYYSRSEAIASFDNSVFSYTGMIKGMKDLIEIEGNSRNPVMITGEDGTGKESVAFILYANSRLSNHPFTSIDCRLIDERSWTYLIEHHNSPLLSRNHTIYFSNVDALDGNKAQQLLANLVQSDVCKRNKVILSAVCKPNEFMSEVAAEFANRLCCINIHIPPLKDRRDDIEYLLNSSINHLNVALNKQVVAVEPAGISMLSEFDWPQNLTQLKRVLTNLVIKAEGTVIKASDVEEALHNECCLSLVSGINPSGKLEDDNRIKPINLNRTLEEINCDIIKRVIDDNNGNQTMAAKKLGIGRTTLWRYINK